MFLLLLVLSALLHPCIASKQSSKPTRILKYLPDDFQADPLTSLQSPVNIHFSSSPPAVNGARNTVTLSDQPSTSILLKYTITLPSDFRWGRGGRLPGISGGGQECTSSSTKPLLPDYCWFMQLGWKSNSLLSAITRLPNGTPSLTKKSVKLQRGVPMSIEMRLTLNSPGMTDGEASIRVNNSTLIKTTGMSFSINNLQAKSFLLEARYSNGQVPAPARSASTSGEQMIVVDNIQVLKAFKIIQVNSDPLPSPQPLPATNPIQPSPVQQLPASPVQQVSPSPVSQLPPALPPPPPHPPAAPYSWVDLNPDQIRRTLALTSIFENSNTTLQYGYCEDNKDGRGYTFGYCGFTTGTGDGLLLLKDYLTRKPADTLLAPFIPILTNLSKIKSPDTSQLIGFCQAVNSLGDDPDFRAAQDSIQKSMYFDPAMRWARNLGINYAITKAQLYDAIINHGEGSGDLFSIDYIVNATNAVMYGPPLVGVDEIAWLKAFFDAREKKLIAHGGKSAARRVGFYRELLNAGNVDMGGPIYIDRVPRNGSGGWQLYNVYYGVFTISSNGKRGPTAQKGHKLTVI